MGTHDTMHPADAGTTSIRPDFEQFVRDTEPRLGRALAAAYGFEEGRDATAEALAYAFEHWDRLRHIANRVERASVVVHFLDIGQPQVIRPPAHAYETHGVG